MPSLLTSSLCLLLAASSPAVADYLVDSSFKLDVHSHVVPDIYRQALIDAGYPVKNGTLFTDGFPVPSWDLESHIAAMDTNGVNYSTISISAPGVNFLADDCCSASIVARQLNLAMYNYTQAYPTRLGAMCILPLPDIEASLAEIEARSLPYSDPR
jgi:predicted TIM-barrel fold metal-dependent hydrolase